MSTRYIQKIAGPASTSIVRDLFGVDKGNAGIAIDTGDAVLANVLKYNQNGKIVSVLDDGGSGPARSPIVNSKLYAMGNAAAAISMFKVATVTLTGFAGGVLWYTYVATDGTDVHALTGMVTYAAVDKAGTVTATITEASGNQAKAVSSGTITIAWTATTGTDTVTFKAATTDSLTTTTANLVYTILPLSGTVVTL